MTHFSIRLWPVIKVGFIMTTSDDQISGWAEKKLQNTSKPKTTPKRDHGHCLVVCCWSDPQQIWIPVKPLYLRSMLKELMRYTGNCKAYSQHSSTARAQFFSMTTLNCASHNQHFKSWMNWAMKFWLMCHIHLASHQLTTTTSRILTAFCMENVLYPAGCRKSFPRVHRIPKHGFLCYRNKQTYLLLAKVYWWMVPILINQCMFEPSYNDLKFTVWNCNYFCTNLI